MREISENEVLDLLRQGKNIQCKISLRDDFQLVKTELDFKNLVDLKNQGVQMAKFFCESDSKLPENALELSLDDAIKLVSKGEKVYGHSGETEAEEFNNVSDIMQFYRVAVLRGKPVFYWLV